MKTASANKLKTKNIITVVLLSLINVLIFLAGSLWYATPITILLIPVFFALVAGVMVAALIGAAIGRRVVKKHLAA